MFLFGCVTINHHDESVNYGIDTLMFQHTVHFWLKDDLTQTQRSEFIESVRGLSASEHVAKCRVGVPAGTPREIVDNSYDVQLTCWFNSPADHDQYQSPDDPVHKAFIESYKDYWTRVLIYDSVEP
jgi:hypothetical protein